MNSTAQDPEPPRPLSIRAPWHPRCYQRAVAFVTDPDERLLVFDHLDVDAGTQVPAGGIHLDEPPEASVMRELEEESGIGTATIVRKLGEAWNRSEPGNVPAGLEEQIQHVFHLRFDDDPDERWDWADRSGGKTIVHRFAFRWVSLDEAERQLWSAQAVWLHAVRLSLRHPI